MDQGDVTFAVQQPAQDVFYLSWVAYIRPVVLFLVMGAIGLIVSQSARDANFILVGYGILFVAIIKVIYDFAWRRRFVFYYDDDGVWVFRGLLPWKKGVGGVKWRDIDEATFDTGFFSWLTKSYRVRVGHRFTQSNEILVTHIKRGNQAAAVINQKLMQDFPN
ncbi:hypothetical protein [Sodalis sp. RH20]|uniref:hypothetical protein n=1 Tax=unclassified Sodalis (in: enterobacteria) TaxID=2636512 RepID=UPI0039B4C22F